MQHICLTPFGGRSVAAALKAVRAPVDASESPDTVDKWAVFAALRTARSRYGVTDRDLTVLNALLGFLPGRELAEGAQLVVHPSNASLSERAHGMAESTLRRHLAALVAAGLIRRQDSPNGKRYARRGRGGQVELAFGFDLAPLLRRAAEFARAEAEVTEAAEALRRQREQLVLLLRDIAGLIAHARAEGVSADLDQPEAQLAALRPLLRRKPDPEGLSRGLAQAAALRAGLLRLLDVDPAISNGSAARNERHHQNTESDLIESEQCDEPVTQPPAATPGLPLPLVLKACPDIEPYARNGLRTWPDLVAAAIRVAGMMGISPSAWQQAASSMGPETAAITVSAMLQRFTRISNPGGYLRSLARRAIEGAFSPGPMVMALLRPS